MMEAYVMKNAWRVVLSTAAGLVLVAGLSAFPQSGAQDKQPGQAQAATQSVTGKITAVDKSSFTLSVASAPQQHELQSSANANATPSTMTFQIDKNTTVDGSLKVGSTADVTYRQDGGSYVAISVRVTP
jgi:Cu/Ag efflux protein CusF